MKKLAFLCLFTVAICIFQFCSSVLDRKTHAVFCDVGQGDGALIRMGFDEILIDAGPEARILECLGNYMPFSDRTIELVFISHPQKDHMEGLLYVLDSYRVMGVVLSEADSDDALTRRIKQKLSMKSVPVYRVSAGNTISLATSSIHIIWPSKEYIKDHSVSTYRTGEGNLVSVDLNDTSLIFRFSQGSHSILYTGDASPHILNMLTDRNTIHAEILKVPHHGSKNGLTRSFLLLADPTLSVISVGKNNSYKHPSREILDLFRALNKYIVRTDMVGSYDFTFFPDTYK